MDTDPGLLHPPPLVALGRLEPGREERGSQPNAGLADRRSRASVIAERGFQGSRTAVASSMPSSEMPYANRGSLSIRRFLPNWLGPRRLDFTVRPCQAEFYQVPGVLTQAKALTFRISLLGLNVRPRP
jgi:hypothetical protein